MLLFFALISYSPHDPNFIFPENLQIHNILGFHGSYTSDLFFQSIGIVSYLIPITLFLTGINIYKNKEIFLFVESLFFTVIYSLIGSLFFAFFYGNSFELYINGNGGFVGTYLNQNFIENLIISNNNIAYYLLVFLITIFFLLSINLNPTEFYLLIKKSLNLKDF